MAQSTVRRCALSFTAERFRVIWRWEWMLIERLRLLSDFLGWKPGRLGQTQREVMLEAFQWLAEQGGFQAAEDHELVFQIESLLVRATICRPVQTQPLWRLYEHECTLRGGERFIEQIINNRRSRWAREESALAAGEARDF